MKIRFQVDNNGIIVGAGVIDIDEAIGIGSMGGGLALKEPVKEWQEVTAELAMRMNNQETRIKQVIADIAELKLKLSKDNLEMFNKMWEEVNKNVKDSK